MKPLIKKELGHYFHNPFGYIVVVLFALFANFLFLKDVFVIGQVSMRQFFMLLPWIGMVFVPAIAMRSLSEEKRTNTIEILQTLSLTATQIVLAKYIAIMIVCAIGLGLTLGLPVSMSILGAQSGGGLYLPEVLMGYVGSLLFFSMAAGLSIFFSGSSVNQVVAFLGAAIVLFVLNVMSTDIIGNLVPKAVEDALAILSPMNQLTPWIKGILDLRSVFYYLSVAGISLFLTVADLEKKS